jgi:hypothetical protein
MNGGAATLLVRRRLVAVSIGFAAFTVLGVLATADTWAQPWFFVGLGVAVSATFLEPYFGTPRAAIANASAGIGACVGADPGAIEGLWIALAAFFGVVTLAGIIAAVGRVPAIPARQFAARFGRANVVGAAVLSLIVLTEADAGRSGFELLAVAAAILVASVYFDWAAVWSQLRRPHEAATALAAVGPGMLLVAAASRVFREGDNVEVDAGSAGATDGYVVARMPHAEGLRYGIALSDEWTAVSRGFPQEMTLRKREGGGDLVGAIGAGTTERVVEFDAFSYLTVGDPLVMQASGRRLLYQVARLRLGEASWAGSRSLLPHASAQLVGWPEGTWIRSLTHLPRPHEPIIRAGNLTGTLPEGFTPIGKVKGTGIPLGLRVDADRRGHIAILGMSGMGKTAVAHRVCSALGSNHVVVALDTTGEYESRLAFPEWGENDFSTIGHFVYQPAGDPPAKAATFIEQCMKAGAAEYQAGETPSRRVVLLEEAHTFLPEWNVALRAQQERVAFSTRMIMQARKFGVTFMIVSQRTAVVSKSALSQCENYIILKTLDQTGLEYLESLVGPEMRNAIPSLERYEAMCVGPAFNSDAPVIISLDPP